MLKKIIPFALLITLLGTSCTHYLPLHYLGKGKPSTKAIRSCTDHFFGIPLAPERTSYQVLTHEQGLVESDIHSFDTSVTYVFFPIYYKSCVIANLTAQGTKKVKDAKNLLIRDETPEDIRENKESSFYLYGKKKITSPRGCDKLPQFNRVECKNTLKGR